MTSLSDDLGVGACSLSVNLCGYPLTLFTYRPVEEFRGALILFSGRSRAASLLCKKAETLASVAGLTLVVPLLDKEVFPTWRYNRAGVIRGHRLQPPDQWTAPLLQAIIDWTRDRIRKTRGPICLFGYSAGGQLLSRICAYSPLRGIDQYVICSPSAYVAPTGDQAVPYGFLGICRGQDLERRLRAYLALPITIYLGTEDTGKHNLAVNDLAMCQGDNRLDRGRRVFAMARSLADRCRWICNWRLVEVSGVGHSAANMLQAPQCLDIVKRTRSVVEKDNTFFD